MTRAAVDYSALLTSEHNQQPWFKAVVEALAQAPVDAANLANALPSYFDLDTATGVQLDAVGLWVGIQRFVAVPLVGVYFSWDSTVLLGWNSGNWQGPNDPSSGLQTLDDESYRTLIRAKIAANNWDGTLQGMAQIFQLVMTGGQTPFVQDNQDMTMIVGYVGPPLTAVQQALLTGGYLPLKPSGVGTAFYALPANTGPMFAWDSDSAYFKGWDTGSWCIPS